MRRHHDKAPCVNVRIHRSPVSSSYLQVTNLTLHQADTGQPIYLTTAGLPREAGTASDL